MKLQLCLVLLFLCLKGSYSTISSYPSSGDGLSFLCGCDSARQTKTLKCQADQVIQMEPGSYLMRGSVAIDNDYCGNLNFTTCKESSPEVLDRQNSIEVYKKCTFKNSCDIKIAGVQESNERFVNYPFYCHTVTDVHDISEKIDINQSGPILYLIGENHTGQKIDCDCVVTGPVKMRLEIYFIHLKPTSCSKVKFLYGNVQMFRCSTNDTTMLNIRYFNVETEFKVEIRDMEPDKDVLFFRFWGYGNDMSVNCGGCSKTRVTSAPTSSLESTTNRRTTHPLIADNPSTARPTTEFLASIIPTTDNPSTARPTTDFRASIYPTTPNPSEDRTTTDFLTSLYPTTDNSFNDNPTPDNSKTDRPETDKAVEDQTLNNVYAMFGGIIAALIIVTLFGIGIYCFTRKRKKPKNVPNEPIPPVLSSNEYADFHHPIGTDHHYQELMDYQNVIRQNTPTGPESQ